MPPLAALLDSPGLAPLSATVSALVAVLALVMALVAFGAMRRRGNRALRWVALAFLVFSAKNVFSAVNVVTHLVQHDAIELVLSLFDLALLALLFIPLAFRRRG